MTLPPLGPAPDWLTAAERDTYARVAALLGNTATALDVDAVARYACLLLHWRRCNEQVTREGLTVCSKSGPTRQATPKQNPLCRVLLSLSGELRALESCLGLNAASRHKLGEPEPQADAADRTENKFFPRLRLPAEPPTIHL